MSLNGKTVIVTGASRGIGAASAEEFARKGATVVLAAQDEKKTLSTCKENWIHSTSPCREHRRI